MPDPVLQHGRCGQGLDSIPPVTDPPLIAGFRNPEMLSPFRETFRFISDCYQRVRSAISSLLNGRSPFAILFRVSPSVVFPLKCFTCGSLSHISKKVHKPHTPFRANNDAAFSVIPVVLVVWIVAPSNHGSPSSVPPDLFGRHPEFRLSCGVETPARLSVSSSYSNSSKRALLSAVTSEYPESDFTDGVGILDGYKSPKSLACNVLEIASPSAEVGCRFIHADFMFGFSAGRLLNTAAPHGYYTMENE